MLSFLLFKPSLMSPWLSVKIFFRTDFAHMLFLKYFIPGILLLLLGPSLLFSSPGVHDYQGIHGWVPEALGTL